MEIESVLMLQGTRRCPVRVGEVKQIDYDESSMTVAGFASHAS